MTSKLIYPCLKVIVRCGDDIGLTFDVVPVTKDANGFCFIDLTDRYVPVHRSQYVQKPFIASASIGKTHSGLPKLFEATPQPDKAKHQELMLARRSPIILNLEVPYQTKVFNEAQRAQQFVLAKGRGYLLTVLSCSDTLLWIQTENGIRLVFLQLNAVPASETDQIWNIGYAWWEPMGNVCSGALVLSSLGLEKGGQQ